MELEVGFGNGVQRFTVPERNLQGVLTPNPVPHALTGEREVRRALSSPIGAPLLREVIHPGEKIAIITSDITRPMPTYTVMPALLDELYTVADCGCGVLDVTVEHPVYGQLSGQLQVFSRYDADVFWDALQKNGAQPLCSLTGDIHLHTLVCPDEARKARVLAALEEKGYLMGLEK